MEVSTFSNVNMELFIIIVNLLIILNYVDRDSPLFKFDKLEMKSSYIPVCKCETPGLIYLSIILIYLLGKVRPNVLMFNDSTFNPYRSNF